VEWIGALRGSTVGLDTGPLIYYIEEHPAFLARIKPFFEAGRPNAAHEVGIKRQSYGLFDSEAEEEDPDSPR
jgi:hypothetical protein